MFLARQLELLPRGVVVLGHEFLAFLLEEGQNLAFVVIETPRYLGELLAQICYLLALSLMLLWCC